MKNKASKNILLAVMGGLILAQLAATVITINGALFVNALCKIVSLAFIALYGFLLYKKPHGNTLKHAMILVAAAEMISAAQCLQMNHNSFILNVVWLLVAAVLIYVAGRLNRIEQNKYLLSAAAAIHLVRTFIDVLNRGNGGNPLRMFTWFSGTIAIVTLMIAYFVRYKEHREAGLMDAPGK